MKAKEITLSGNDLIYQSVNFIKQNINISLIRIILLSIISEQEFIIHNYTYDFLVRLIGGGMLKNSDPDNTQSDHKRDKENPQPDYKKDDPHNAPESGDKRI